MIDLEERKKCSSYRSQWELGNNLNAPILRNSNRQYL